MSKVINGFGVCEGIVVNKLQIINNEDIKVVKKTDVDAKQQIEKFKQAVFKTIDQYKELEQQSKAKNDEREINILEVFMQMAKDPIFTSRVTQFINQEKCNADYAVQQIAKEIFTQFSNIDDPYFRDRGVDVNDVGYRIIKNILGYDNIDLSDVKSPAIIMINDITPTMMTQINKDFVKGIITNVAGFTSHVAIMARTLNIPTIMNVPEAFDKLKDGQFVAIDGNKGDIYYDLSDSEIKKFNDEASTWSESFKKLEVFKDKKAISKDNKEFNIEANISDIDEINNLENSGIDGVGLFRTEFIYLDSNKLPTEDEQYNIYKKLIEKMDSKRVVIRTMDIGGDKQINYLKIPKTSNPFLGIRGIRYSLINPDIFKTQIKAILRATVEGNVEMMFPMISTTDELRQAKRLVEESKNELKEQKVLFNDDIKIGMMVETPIAALNIKSFVKEADFFSFGTNDLVQYTMAANRLDDNVDYLYQPTNPGFIKLLKESFDIIKANNKRICVCGEMADDYISIPLLVGLGIDVFSLPSSNANRAKSLISNINYTDAQDLVKKSLNSNTSKEVKELVEQFYSAQKMKK